MDEARAARAQGGREQADAVAVSARLRVVGEGPRLRAHQRRWRPTGDVEFWDAVRSLPRRQSQVVALHYVEDLSVSDIADVLEMAPGTVKKHLHDGRKSLARRLRAEEDS